MKSTLFNRKVKLAMKTKSDVAEVLDPDEAYNLIVQRSMAFYLQRLV